MLLARLALGAAGILDLPGSWLWSNAACAIPAVLPLWLLLPSAWSRFRVARPGPLLAVCSVILIPFAAAAVMGGLSDGNADGGWPGVAFAVLLVSAAEELQFRCFLMDLLHGRGRGIIPVLVTSTAFALIHLNNPDPHPMGILNILLFGLVLGALRIRGAGLAGLSALHAVWNIMTGMVVGWNVSGLELPSLFEPRRDPFGAFGPESSLLLSAALLLSIIMLVRTRPAGLAGTAPAGPVALPHKEKT
jgi:membrane protease YdiL (CAAX protease family)